MATKSKKKTQMVGVPITHISKPSGYVERQISGSQYSYIIQDSRQIPKVLSCMSGLSRMCFPGFDWDITPFDESDDTQGKQIDSALKQLKLIDKKIGRIGKSKNVGTINLVRQTHNDTLSFRQSVWEYAQASEGGWNIPVEVQNIPSTSLFRNSLQLGNIIDFIPDKLLPGVVYDMKEDATRIFQSKTAYEQPTELNMEQILYIEDFGIPPETSFLASLVPIIEQWKMMRENLMIALHRGYATPNEVAQLDLNALARAKEAGITIDIDNLIAYATDLIQNQGIETAKLSMAGMNLLYPSLPLASDPTNPDRYLIQEMISHFFMKDITEQLAAAVSTSGSPAKAVIDALVASYRETNGKPWEDWWYRVFLEPNGFGELQVTFDWWDWTPLDKVADANIINQRFRAGGLLINEYRAKNGDPPLTDEEIAKLIEEQQSLKGPKPQQNPMFGGGGVPPTTASPSEEEKKEELIEPSEELVEQVGKLEQAAYEGTLSKEEKRLLELLKQKGKIAEKAINRYFKE